MKPYLSAHVKTYGDVDQSTAAEFCRLTSSPNKVSLEPEFDISLGLPGNSCKYLSIIRARAAGEGGDVQQTGGGAH